MYFLMYLVLYVSMQVLTPNFHSNSISGNFQLYEKDDFNALLQ